MNGQQVKAQSNRTIIDDYIDDEKYDCLFGKSLRIHKKRLRTESLEGTRVYTCKRGSLIDNGMFNHLQKQVSISWIGALRLSRAISSPTNESRHRNRNENSDGEWRRTKRSYDLNNRGEENDCGIFSDSDDEDEISLAQQQIRHSLEIYLQKVADTLEVVGASSTAETMTCDANMELLLFF